MNSKIPNSVFQTFVVHNAGGGIDVKKSIKNFEEHFGLWMKEQADLAPAIIKELSNHKRLGAGKLITFTIHALGMAPTKENQDRIKNAMQELQAKGVLRFQSTDGGHMKGKGAGWVLAGKVAPVTTQQPAQA